jgi:biotin synthesis protein BioG
MKTKFISNNSKDLTVFLTGWGCDNIQFKNYTSSNNLLLCWDYSDLDFEFDFTEYNNIYLIAYSAGVFVAGLIQDKLPKFTKTIAINGNPKMLDKYYGISEDALRFMHNLNLDNYMDFRRNYLVFNEKELEYFNKNTSVRSFESCEEELNKLNEYYNSNTKNEFKFDTVILSDSDKIFNPQHQIEYFKDNYVLLKNQAHHIFPMFKSFDEIINFQ